MRFDCPVVSGREELRDVAVVLSERDLDVAEFGVHTGKGARALLERMGDGQRLHLFDSWEGIRIPWDRGDLVRPVGFWKCDQPDLGDERCRYYRGWFSDTALTFAERHGEQLGLVSLDCDSYESTSDALRGIEGLIRPGTVLIFWTYAVHPAWRDGQYRAWGEIGMKYRYVAQTSRGQVAVRVSV